MTTGTRGGLARAAALAAGAVLAGGALAGPAAHAGEPPPTPKIIGGTPPTRRTRSWPPWSTSGTATPTRTAAVAG
ncbi:hypothetical protein ACFQY7_44460 [Actinomadura luteofluorescens]|uniref:hypothetical protein n=1 Tax=Actinomadura luteofluorescens TaxID=46163 RepID=UPI003637A2EC